ncbi:hypothetical protein KEM55_003664 [Ascosphaera atra]|nr:hypothetical protein KEM55_003664 [Ascosphaera atra]
MRVVISDSDLCTSSGEDNTLTAVWKTFVSPDWLHSTPTIVADFIGAVYDHIKEVDFLTPNSLETLASIPAPLISPHQRSTLLDLLLQYMLTKKCELSNVGILSLMTHLVELPKSSTSRIVSDAKEVWELGKAFTPREVEKNPPYACFRQLFVAVLGRVLLSSESNRRAWFKGLAQLVLEPSQTKSALPLDSLEQFVRVLAIEALIKHQDQLDDAQAVERLQALRKDVCDAISDEVKALYRRAKSQKIVHDDGEKLLAALACLLEFSSMQSKEAIKYLKKIDVSGASWNPKVSQAVMTSRIHLQKLADEEADAFLLSCLSAFSASRLQVQDEKLALCEVQKRLAELSQDQIGELLSRLELPNADGDDFVRRLLIAGVALAGLQPVEDRDSVSSKSLSVFLSQLCACLPLCKTMESFSLLMESVDIILRTQSRSVTQWNVDNLMAALSVAVSPSGLTHLAGTDAPGVLYTRICRVAGMLFLQYRQKLSGRMHLVVPLMQRLLRCLFRYDAIPGAPGVTQAKLAKTVNTLPPWISVDDEACQVTADPEHAFQYTRLLTLLCDPTVSAVQRHSHARPTDCGPVSRLTDNTKKVKSLAGQHLQYVVMEYALCSIRGRLQPAVKAALVPGLYAILDVMTREGMRGMNAAMDGSSRAIFRSLYEDYVRFGRWDQG